jgi:hypothetical protein
MEKLFSLPIDVVNGEVFEFPKNVYLKCNDYLPIGESLVRYYNQDMCSVVKKTFYIKYGDDLLGTSQFNTMEDFLLFQKNTCGCNTYDLFIDGCQLLMDGQKMSI